MKNHSATGIHILSFLLFALPVMLPSAATGNPQSAEEIGLSIARQHKVENAGWGDSRSQARMIIRSANGKERVRQMSVRYLEVAADGDKSIMVFNEPRDVSGTAFLSHSHIDKTDDQWIYLPAVKRVKRIASNNKSGSFMGSEFAYEDLNSFEVEKYRFKYIGEQALDGLPCFVIESYPRDPHSGYHRLLSWLDKDALRFRKIEFYDHQDSLLKVLSINDYEQLGGKYWRPRVSVMENRQNGKVTVMHSDDMQLNTGLTEEDFSMNSLKRAR